MFADYLIITATITTAALIMRNLLNDHPGLDSAATSLPLVRPVLRCGFCTSVWLACIAVLFENPLAHWSAYAIVSFGAGWFTVAAGTLIIKNLIIVLMESGAVLAHLHRSAHEPH